LRIARLRGEVFLLLPSAHDPRRAYSAKSRLHPIALIENEEGIQPLSWKSSMPWFATLSISAVPTYPARALHIAVKNSPRVHFNLRKSEMINEVPNYPPPPPQRRPPLQHSPRPARSRASRAPGQSASLVPGHPLSPHRLIHSPQAARRVKPAPAARKRRPHAARRRSG